MDLDSEPGGLAGDGDRFARTWVLQGGALSPIASGNCDLHDQTMTLTTFCER